MKQKPEAPLHPSAQRGGRPEDLFGTPKLNVEPVVMEGRETYYGFFTRHVGQVEVSVGRADRTNNVVISVCDPEHGTTQIQLSSQELVQEGLRIHRERIREQTPLSPPAQRGGKPEQKGRTHAA